MGLLVGLLFALFATTTTSGFAIIIGNAVYAAIFGAIFVLIAYALTGDRQDYLSRSQRVPARYLLVANTQVAEQARRSLTPR